MTDSRLARHWDAAYAEGEEGRSWTEAEPSESLEAIGSLGLPLDAAIIDVGGGSSRLAARLIEAGHSDVTVLDFSQAGLELARTELGARAGSVEWIAADLLEWRPVRAYAVWHDRALLHFFTDPGERARYADTARAAIAPGGYAIVATFAPEGPDHCSGLPVQRSSAEDVLALLGGGFSLAESSVREHRTPSGTRQPFTWTIARREP